MPGWKSLTNICDPLYDRNFVGPTQSGLGPCGFEALMTLIQNAMTDLIIISTLLVVVAAVIAGIKLVTAGMRGDSGALGDARKMMGSIIMGYAIILTAWLLVYTITSTLLHGEFTLIMN